MSTSRETRVEGGSTPEWERELKQRSALATPQDTARGLFFISMLDAVRNLGDEDSLARCREVLGGQQLMAFFNYPVPLLLRLTEAATRELSGRYGCPQEAMRALGRKGTADFLSSTVGNAVCVLTGKNPKLLLGSIHVIHRMTATYGERSVIWKGPRSGCLIIKHCFMPLPYHEGVLQEILERYGARGVKVHGQQTAPLDGVYDFSWE